MPAMRATIGGLAAVATLMLLAGCAAEPEPGSTPSATGSATPSATTEPTPTSSETPAPTASADPDAAACLAGTWELDQAGLDTFYGDVNGLLSGSGLSFTPQGRAGLTLTDAGQYTWAPELALTADVAGTPIDITIGGQTGGGYTVAGDRITTDGSVTDGLDISATIMGEEADAGEITTEVAQAPITDATFTCEGDTLTLASAISGGTATATLHRQ